MITLRSFLSWTAIAWIGISIFALRTKEYWIFYLLYVWFLAVLMIIYITATIRTDNSQKILDWALIIGTIGILIFVPRTDIPHSSWFFWIIFLWVMMLLVLVFINYESCGCSSEFFWQERIEEGSDPHYWDKRLEREKREEQEKRYKKHYR